MKTIKKFPSLAIIFGMLSVGTAIVLVVQTPLLVRGVLALFWCITGLLGIYQGLKP